MSIEYQRLRDKPPAAIACPQHPGARNDFMRGMVVSGWRRLFRRPYCAVICDRCKEIIGWEAGS